MSEPKVLHKWAYNGARYRLIEGEKGTAWAQRRDPDTEAVAHGWTLDSYGGLSHELARLAPLAPLLDERWTPDEAGLAALPERVRDYIHELLYKAEGLEDLRVMQEDQLKADIEAMRDARASLAEKEAQLAEALELLWQASEWLPQADNDHPRDCPCAACKRSRVSLAIDDLYDRPRAAREKGEGNAEGEG